MNLTDAQLAMLHRLATEGPFRPRGAEWMVFYSLEHMKLARKIDMIIMITDAGRLVAAEGRYADKGRTN